MPKGSGRRPLPTAVKKLRGNPGKRALNPAEPIPAQGEPLMPKHLTGLAAEEWRAIVPELAALGVLSRIDGKALAGYCISFKNWVDALAATDKYGLIVEVPILTKDGDEIGTALKANPAVGQAERAAKLMKSFLVEFGMTPASRSRIRVEKPPAEDPEEAYVRRKMAEASANSHVN